MKPHYLLSLFVLLSTSVYAQDKPPLQLEVKLQTVGDVRFQGGETIPRKGLSAVGLTDTKDILTQWEGETGIKILTLKSGIGKELPPLAVGVPRSFDTYFSTGKGNVALEQLTGYVEGHTQTGNLSLSQVKATVHVTTDQGDINVTNSVLKGDLTARQGHINLTDVSGPFSLLTPQGRSNVTFTEAFFKSQREPFSFGVPNGDIRVSGATATLELEVSTGDITVEKSTSPLIQAKVVNSGNIRLTAVSSALQASTDSGSVWLVLSPEWVKMTGEVLIEGANGDVTVQIPREFQALLQLDLLQTHRFEQPYTVTSNLELNKAAWEDITGDKELFARQLKWQQHVNEGKRVLRIKLRNGNLTLNTY